MSVQKFHLKKIATIEQIFFRQPLHFAKHKSFPKDLLADRLNAMVAAFDAKPFVVACTATGCNKPTTRCSVHRQTDEARLWCDSCNPTSTGVNPNDINILKSFKDIEQHLNGSSQLAGRKTARARRLIRRLGQAKGLPGYVTKKAGIEFFDS